jgi:hypothetical protein
MFLAIITLISGLYLAAVAAWFSIAGLLTIFSGAVIPALCMGIGIETGKVVAVSWVYRNWNDGKFLLKSITILLLLVAMVVTSVGIFGYLSKAHFQQNSPIEQTQLKVGIIDSKIKREQDKIADYNGVIKQLDDTIVVLLKNEKVSSKGGSREVRESQRIERDRLNQQIQTAMDTIASLQDERFNLEATVTNVKMDVGILSYISEAIYHDDGTESVDKAIRILILLIMLSFDPFAVVLLVCANSSLMKLGKKESVPFIPEQHTETPNIETISYRHTFDLGTEYDIATDFNSVIDEVIETIDNESEIDVGELTEDVMEEDNTPNKSKTDKDVRLENIKNKLKNGEIGWITLKKS